MKNDQTIVIQLVQLEHPPDTNNNFDFASMILDQESPCIFTCSRNGGTCTHAHKLEKHSEQV